MFLFGFMSCSYPVCIHRVLCWMPRARSCWVPVQWGGQSLGRRCMWVPNQEPAFPVACWKLRLPSRGTLASWRPGLVGTWGDTERCQEQELGKEPAVQCSSLASSSKSPAGGPGQAGHTRSVQDRGSCTLQRAPQAAQLGWIKGGAEPLCTAAPRCPAWGFWYERETGKWEQAWGKVKRWSRNEHIVFRKVRWVFEPRQGCSNSGHCSQVPNSGLQGREIDVSQRSTVRGWEKAARSCRKEYSDCTYEKRLWSNSG